MGSNSQQEEREIRAEAKRFAAALIAHHTEIRGLSPQDLNRHLDRWGRIAARACHIDPRCWPLMNDPDTAGARIAGYLVGRLAERERQKELARRG